MSETFTIQQVLAAAKQRMLDGRLDEAADLYRQCTEQRPDDVVILSNYGVCLMELGQFDSAADMLEHAAQLQPHHAELQYNLGILAQRRLDWREAKARFDAALDIDADHLNARRGLRDTLSTLGETADALQAARQAISQSDGALVDRLALAQNFHELGDADAAYDAYAAVRERDPDNPLVAANINLAACFRDGAAPGGRSSHFMAALDRLNAAAEMAVGQGNAPRIGFHLFAPYHLDVLKPIFEAVGADAHRMMAIDIDPLVSFRPNIVVTAETHIPYLRRRLPEATFVYVRHGLIDKNALGPALRTADHICLPSEEMCEIVRANYGIQRAELWATGYAHMDSLFTGTTPWPSFRVEAGKKIILYAPTWNAEYSSAFEFGNEIAELLIGERSDVVVVIKPHPNLAATNPELIAAWQSLARTRMDTYVARADEDVMPYLAAADVLVSDVSSVAFAYLAVDRPIIFYTRAGAKDSPLSRQDSVEWRWREVGQEVFDAEATRAAVNHALDRQDLLAERRAACRNELFGNLQDGGAAHRIATQLLAVHLSR